MPTALCSDTYFKLNDVCAHSMRLVLFVAFAKSTLRQAQAKFCLWSWTVNSKSKLEMDILVIYSTQKSNWPVVVVSDSADLMQLYDDQITLDRLFGDHQLLTEWILTCLRTVFCSTRISETLLVSGPSKTGIEVMTPESKANSNLCSRRQANSRLYSRRRANSSPCSRKRLQMMLLRSGMVPTVTVVGWNLFRRCVSVM